MHKLIALFMFVGGCSKLTIVGVSGDKDQVVESTPPLVAAPLRAATQIVARDDEWLIAPDAALGDIDGDGYADFLLHGSLTDGYDRYERIVFTEKTGTAYLFYGRDKFPGKLRSTDADATFETGLNAGATSLGDVNGDGLADFGLTDRDGFEIVYGTPARWTGHHTKLSTGAVVHYPAEEIYEGFDGAAVGALSRVGDLNGDGRDDFAVCVGERDEHGNIYGFGWTYYIFEGRADGLPSGQWDPSSAVAKLDYGADPEDGKQTVHQFGDLNGDGYSDLLTYGADGYSYQLYYGKPEGLRGTVTGDQADAQIAQRLDDGLYVLGDLDGDGADEIVLSTTNELRIVYGSAARYSGRVELQADLTFSDQGPYGGAGLVDVDGDGLKDLLIQANREVRRIPDNWDPIPVIDTRLYTLFGTGTRLTGQQPQLVDEYRLVGVTAPAALTSGEGFAAGPLGDIDGDGSTDLVLGVYGSADPASSQIYLLPGAPLDPE